MIIGSTYADFAINVTNNSSNSNVEGNLASTGKVTLSTNINNLYLNLNSVVMSKK